MKGELPPSSIETFLTVPAHCSRRIFPTAVEPVKDSFRTMGFPVSSPPTAEDGPVTTLKTPAGIPARVASSPRASAESGVDEAGRATTVQPAASAGPALRVIMALGKFQGVMEATTPTGSFVTTILRSERCVGITSP